MINTDGLASGIAVGIVTALTGLLFYILIGFTFLTWDVRDWEETQRAVLVLSMIIAGVWSFVRLNNET